MTDRAQVAQILGNVQTLEGENIQYLFSLLPKPLTPEHKVELLIPKRPHGKRLTWQDEALEDLREAIELGELDTDVQF